MKSNNKKRPLSIYIHVPFCLSKCFYCDFTSFSNKMDSIHSYFEAMKKEIIFHLNSLRNSYIRTIFIGGGTPSVVDSFYIKEIIDIIKSKYDISEDSEISIECNPETLNFEKIKNYKDMGINRLSLGLQVCQNDLLKKIGRVHKFESFLNSFKWSRKAGFSNINIDLMFGIPEQSMINWIESVNTILELEPEHISCYSLKIEDGTVFKQKLDNKEFDYPDDELDRKMYHYAIEKFLEKGYEHYEISNFALENLDCKHNMNYWETGEYLGFGVGAHSYFNGVRYSNISSFEEYIKDVNKNKLPIQDFEYIDLKESIDEFVLLGLRKIIGISSIEFYNRFNIELEQYFGNEISKLQKNGLLNIQENNFRLTKKGLDYANQVFIEFI